MRDSSLSACTQAVMAAEVGPPRPGLRLPRRGGADGPATTCEHNTRDGLHIASLAGAGSALVAGFGGMRDQARAGWRFAPRLPRGITRLAFRLCYRGACSAGPRHAEARRRTGSLGPPLTLSHHGKEFQVDE